MIYLTEGGTATYTVTPDQAGKDVYLIEVLANGLWIQQRGGSSIAITGAPGALPSAGLLIDRLDPTFGVRSGVTIDIAVTTSDLLRAWPSDGVKVIDTRVTYTDGTTFLHSQDVTIDRTPANAYAFFLRANAYGGYVRYFAAGADAERIVLTWDDGSAVTRDIATTPDGIIWLPDTGALDEPPVRATLLDRAGNESGNILAGVRLDQYDPPHTPLVPWAVPPYVRPSQVGFGALLQAVERSLDIEPEGAGELVSPATSRGAYLDALARLFSAPRRPGERDEELRGRVFSAMRAGKATPAGLEAILTQLYNVPVEVLDHNVDSTIPVGEFVVYLFATPRIGLTRAAELAKAYRAAGLAPTLSLTLKSDPAWVNLRWSGPHAHRLHTSHAVVTSHRPYLLDSTWQLDGTIPLSSKTMIRVTDRLVDTTVV